MLPAKYWQVIKDDSKRTFEVLGYESNTNPFTNRTYAMQRAGMNVSCMTPPVSGRNFSKEAIKIIGYTREDGLYRRLQEEYRKLTYRIEEDWDIDE